MVREWSAAQVFGEATTRSGAMCSSAGNAVLSGAPAAHEAGTQPGRAGAGHVGSCAKSGKMKWYFIDMGHRTR